MHMRHTLSNSLQDVVRSFKAWTQKLVFPNVTFLMSVGDTSQCRRRGACAAPFLSFAKRVGGV